MIILGIILLLVGLFVQTTISGLLTTTGVILIVVGVVLMVAGRMGHAVGGRRHYY
jgi:membrane-bound ClpP family serine protease